MQAIGLQSKPFYFSGVASSIPKPKFGEERTNKIDSAKLAQTYQKKLVLAATSYPHDRVLRTIYYAEIAKEYREKANLVLDPSYPGELKSPLRMEILGVLESMNGQWVRLLQGLDNKQATMVYRSISPKLLTPGMAALLRKRMVYGPREHSVKLVQSTYPTELSNSLKAATNKPSEKSRSQVARIYARMWNELEQSRHFGTEALSGKWHDTYRTPLTQADVEKQQGIWQEAFTPLIAKADEAWTEILGELSKSEAVELLKLLGHSYISTPPYESLSKKIAELSKKVS